MTPVRERPEPSLAGPTGAVNARRESAGVPDVPRSVCRGDIDRWIERQRIAAPPASTYSPVWRPERETTELDLAEAGIGTVVWAIGYRPNYRLCQVGVFDGSGRPTHVRGVTSVRGLFVLGVPWLHTWGSGRFLGIARDAEHVASQIVRPLRSGVDLAGVSLTARSA